MAYAIFADQVWSARSFSCYCIKRPHQALCNFWLYIGNGRSPSGECSVLNIFWLCSLFQKLGERNVAITMLPRRNLHCQCIICLSLLWVYWDLQVQSNTCLPPYHSRRTVSHSSHNPHLHFLTPSFFVSAQCNEIAYLALDNSSRWQAIIVDFLWAMFVWTRTQVIGKRQCVLVHKSVAHRKSCNAN